MIYNTDPARVDIYAVKGDTINMTFHVMSELISTGRKFYVQPNSNPSHGTAHTLGDLRIHVRRKDSLLIKEWISGVSPSDIVIAGNTFHLYDIDGFGESGLFDYDVEENDGTGYYCIMFGQFWVKKEITI